MRNETKLRTVILASDVSEFSKGAENLALNICQLSGAKLIVTHILFYNPKYMSI